MSDDFESFVIEHLGPSALAGGTMSLYDVAKLAFMHGQIAGATAMRAMAVSVCWDYEQGFHAQVVESCGGTVAVSEETLEEGRELCQSIAAAIRTLKLENENEDEDES